MPDENIVQLRYATLPSVLRVVAIHYWFAVFDAKQGTWTRWEVWQKPKVVPTSWGHVHKNLMDAGNGGGGGPFHIAHEWRGLQAREIIAVLDQPDTYPYCNSYRAWPGPNSNTYAAWILKKAHIPMDLHPMAIGKDYHGLAGFGLSPTFTGIHFDTPIAGFKLGLKDGVEAHLLCMTVGVTLYPPALKTPFGRLGFNKTPATAVVTLRPLDY